MVFTIYGHGGHLGHVTWTTYINFRSPFLRMLHMKFGFNLQRRRSLKLWTDDDGRRTTDDGRTPEHGHPISSPCEPVAQVS